MVNQRFNPGDNASRTQYVNPAHLRRQQSDGGAGYYFTGPPTRGAQLNFGPASYDAQYLGYNLGPGGQILPGVALNSMDSVFGVGSPSPSSPMFGRMVDAVMSGVRLGFIDPYQASRVLAGGHGNIFAGGPMNMLQRQMSPRYPQNPDGPTRETFQTYADQVSRDPAFDDPMSGEYPRPGSMAGQPMPGNIQQQVMAMMGNETMGDGMGMNPDGVFRNKNGRLWAK